METKQNWYQQNYQLLNPHNHTTKAKTQKISSENNDLDLISLEIKKKLIKNFYLNQLQEHGNPEQDYLDWVAKTKKKEIALFEQELRQDAQQDEDFSEEQFQTDLKVCLGTYLSEQQNWLEQYYFDHNRINRKIQKLVSFEGHQQEIYQLEALHVKNGILTPFTQKYYSNKEILLWAQSYNFNFYKKVQKILQIYLDKNSSEVVISYIFDRWKILDFIYQQQAKNLKETNSYFLGCDLFDLTTEKLWTRQVISTERSVENRTEEMICLEHLTVPDFYRYFPRFSLDFFEFNFYYLDTEKKIIFLSYQIEEQDFKKLKNLSGDHSVYMIPKIRMKTEQALHLTYFYLKKFMLLSALHFEWINSENINTFNCLQ